MFEKLVESTTNEKETKKQTAYFGLTTVVYSILILGVLVWSVFSFDLSDLNRNSDLTLETLVTPAIDIQPEPLAPRIYSRPKNDTPKNTSKNFDVLTDPVADIKTSTKPPDGINNDKVNVEEIRKGVKYIVGDKPSRAEFFGEGDTIGRSNPPVLENAKLKFGVEEVDVPPPPVVKKPEVVREEKKKTTVSKGVVNGIAIKLPKPVYPTVAKAINASGAVNVQVTIDEHGNVVSAVAASGHPLLKAAAVSAAKQAKFTPTILSDKPVIVTGVIIYNFVP